MTPKQSQGTVEGLPKEALTLLREAAANEATWTAAMQDPLGFLQGRGIMLLKGCTLELYEAAWDPQTTTFHVRELSGAADMADSEQQPLASAHRVSSWYTTRPNA